MRAFIATMLLGTALAAGTAYAARPAAHASNHAVGTVGLVVLDDLKIMSRSKLDFGTITDVSGAGAVIVTPDRDRRVRGRVQMTGGGFAPAHFAIRGRANQVYTINIPDEVTFTADHVPRHAHGVQDLTVTDFTVRSANTGRVTNDHSRLDRRGADRLSVGGTLIVPANASPGLYSGYVPLTVSY